MKRTASMANALTSVMIKNGFSKFGFIKIERTKQDVSSVLKANLFGRVGSVVGKCVVKLEIKRL